MPRRSPFEIVLSDDERAELEAHLVGGGVRDLLLGREPKDFDIATDARPEEVREVFRNCRLIGRRFRLAHVHFGQEIIEVATFRSGQAGEQADNNQTDEGMLLRDNVYGTLEEDALRRDFLDVVDRGEGVSDEARARLFEPFMKGRLAKVGEDAGNGMRRWLVELEEAHRARS